MAAKSLLALACGTFALGIAEFSMMGILSPVASAMGVTIPQAGDFISAYALGVSLGAPLPLFFRRRSLKSILLGLCLIILFGNFLTSLSNGYLALICARFLSGLPHGAYFGVAAIVATALVDRGQKATAIAVMVAGMSVANVIGVPAATWLTHLFSWRLTFFIAAAAGGVALAGIWCWVPRLPPRPDRGLKGEFVFLKTLPPWLIYAGTFFGQGSIYCWYSYMEPIMLEVAHVPPGAMTWVMAVAGTGMVIGGLLCGRLADRYRPALVSGLTALAAAPLLGLIYLCSANAILSTILTFLGAAALFGLGGPLQYLIVRFAPGGEILGGAGIQIAFNVSNACAAFMGGLTIRAGWGLASPALVGIPMAAASAAVLFLLYRRYGREEA